MKYFYIKQVYCISNVIKTTIKNQVDFIFNVHWNFFSLLRILPCGLYHGCNLMGSNVLIYIKWADPSTLYYKCINQLQCKIRETRSNN